MRRLSYEQLERRELFATLAAVELPPSPLAVIESSTRDFIDSTLKQVAPSSNEVALQTGPANVVARDGGDQIQVTYVVMNVGAGIPSVDSQHVVFTFTVRPNHAIGFHAALLRNLATPRSSFPLEDQLEATAFMSLTSETTPTTAPSSLLVEDSDSILPNFPRAEERRTRTTSARSSRADAPANPVPLPAELRWQLLCSEATDAGLASDEGPTAIRAVNVRQEPTAEPQRESVEPNPGVMPISDRMSFLTESPQSLPEAPQTSNASAMLQILIGLAGFPDPLQPNEAAVTVEQADLGEAEFREAATEEVNAPSLSWKACVVTLGIGFTLHARHRERSREVNQQRASVRLI